MIEHDAAHWEHSVRLLCGYQSVGVAVAIPEGGSRAANGIAGADVYIPNDILRGVVPRHIQRTVVHPDFKNEIAALLRDQVLLAPAAHARVH